MLTLSNGAGGIPLRCDDYYIKQLASGLDELLFSISIWDENYAAIQEESSIREESGAPVNYIVKAIDGGKQTATVKCQIDLDDWKSVLNLNYNSGSNSVGDIVNAVKPTGWTVTNHSGITYKRTIKLDAATPYDVLDQCRSTFKNITFRFDNINKNVDIINMTGGTNLGAFVTRDLNLTANDYKGKSSNFATRLYAYGKDGMSFADINGGKPYVENHTYSNRVICAYWSDERYTVKSQLLQDAQAKIDEMAVPQRSFDLSVVDLAAVDPVKYGELDFKLFSVVSLIDQTRSGSKVDHTVVERWIYPYHPEKNKVTLSTAAPRIQSQVSQIINSVTNVNSDWNQQQAAYINALTASILGASGGSVRLLDTNDDGEPDTLYIADDPDPDQAVHVWRFNYQGWAASTNGYNGPFTIGATFDDGGTIYANVLKVLNINADNINAGTINADNINVTNINGANIKNGTVGSDPLASGAVIEAKIGSGAVTSGKIGSSAVTTTKISDGAVTGGSSGKIASSTITTSNTSNGINTNLGYGAAYGEAISGVDANNFSCKVLTNTSYYMYFYGNTVTRQTVIINGTQYVLLGWKTGN